MCEISVDETADVFLPKYRKANKKHKCHTCAHQIQKGEMYLLTTTIFDGYVDTDKACMVCATMWEDFFESHGTCYSSSYLYEMLNDCIEGLHRRGWWSHETKKMIPAYKDGQERVEWASRFRAEDRKWRTYKAVLMRRLHNNKKTLAA